MQDIQLQASNTVLAVLRGESLAHLLPRLWRRHPGLAPGDRGAIQDLCYGTLRDLPRLRVLLGLLLKRPLQDADVEALLLVALFQLRSTRAAPHAVVDQAVQAVARIGKGSARALVNAVLRNYLRVAPALDTQCLESEEARHGFPSWWIDEVRRGYPGCFAQLLEAGNTHAPMTLRVNRRQVEPEAYLASLGAAGIRARPAGGCALVLERPHPVEQLPGFASGQASVQDLAAQAAAPLLDARDGQRVLDACAAPGGKTAHILERAVVELTALDIDATRLERVAETLARLRLSDRSPQLRVADAADPDAWWDGRPYQRILLDAPCSGSGVTRRHPDIKWLRRPEDLERFAASQSRLLASLWRVLETGGKLLYVTCSVFAQENQERVSEFLRNTPAARLLAWRTGPDLPDLELPPGDAPTGTQLLPNATHDGFFYALLEKA